MTSRPRWWAVLVIRAATRALSSDDLRDRYRRELAAELCSLTRRQQAVLVLGFVTRVWSLRATWWRITHDAAAHPPQWCRLRLHHRWEIVHLPEGGRYRRCRACHLDDDGTYLKPADSMMYARIETM